MRWFAQRNARAYSACGQRRIRSGRRLHFERLEDRRLLTSDSFDLIGSTDYFNNPAFAQFDGTGVAIAILDTGADLDHPDFGDDNVAPFGVADRIRHQADFFNADSDASDDNGWRTHTASIIAKLAPLSSSSALRCNG
jgi:subtilisin family serine protease